MRKHKNKIYSLEDVRKWRELKKDELDLEILKFHAEKAELKNAFKKGLAQVMLYEILVSAGEKIISSLLKSAFSHSKKADDPSKKESAEE
jgi:hypothetical protein